MITVQKYNKTFQDDWDRFNEISKNGNFLFQRNYLEYHSDRFIDHSLMLLMNNNIIAIFPANENGDQIHSHGGLTFGSLVMGKDIKAIQVLEIFSLLKQYYSDLGFKKIIYKSIPTIFHKYPSEEDLYALFRIDATLVRRDISSVVLLKEKIRFSESKRQSVTKCVKNNITVAENQDFNEYWELLNEVLTKFGTSPVHTIDEIVRLKESFPTNIRLFEARKEDELLAGIVIYDYGKVVHTQYMANSQEGRKIGALDYINHYLMNEIFFEREYYSFGISTEQQGRELNSGLIQQKEMMGGRGITLDFYSISL